MSSFPVSLICPSSVGPGFPYTSVTDVDKHLFQVFLTCFVLFLAPENQISLLSVFPRNTTFHGFLWTLIPVIPHTPLLLVPLSTDARHSLKATDSYFVHIGSWSAVTAVKTLNLRQWLSWYTIALFYNAFVIILCMYRALHSHHQEVELYWYSI